jgi:hypothetical protein
MEEIMNELEVKEALLRIYPAKDDFIVFFIEEKNNKYNGVYRPMEKKIVLYTKNFSNDDTLMYTAVHEMAHHILRSELNILEKNKHSGFFWAVFYDLLDIAEKLKIYEPSKYIDDKTALLIENAKKISVEMALWRRELGEVILKLSELCEENGARFEDVVERRAKISHSGMIEALGARRLAGLKNAGFEADTALIKRRGRCMALMNMLDEEKTLVQAREKMRVFGRGSRLEKELLVDLRNRKIILGIVK